MPQSLTNILVHATFSTRDRRPVLQEDLRPEIFAYLAGIFRDEGCPSFLVGGHVDHIHALFRLSRTDTIAHLISEVKSSSSRWLKTKASYLREFSWQSGYSGFSVSPSSVPQVLAYIRQQDEHHRTWSFQDELRRILQENETEYDERYLWD